MGQVLLPPTIGPIGPGPVLFLAGPIQGAPQWQNDAITLLAEYAPELTIANPRRPTFGESDFNYNAQVDWETHHLRRAADNGAILFWLAAEAEHFCGRAYAQTTRFELAEWLVHRLNGKAQIALGIDDSFTGARYVRRRVGQDHPGLSIFNALEATCIEAAELCRQTRF